MTAPMISSLFLLQSQHKTRIARHLVRSPTADLHHATIKTESPLQLKVGWQFSGGAASLQPFLSHSSETVFWHEDFLVVTMSQTLVLREQRCWYYFKKKIITGFCCILASMMPSSYIAISPSPEIYNHKMNHGSESHRRFIASLLHFSLPYTTL